MENPEPWLDECISAMVNGDAEAMRHDSAERPRLAPSLAELLARLAEQYERPGG
jgi:hypothetical protein